LICCEQVPLVLPAHSGLTIGSPLAILSLNLLWNSVALALKPVRLSK